MQLPAGAIAAFPILFPACLVGVWLAASVALGEAIGWRVLAERYGDHPDEIFARFRGQSAAMGVVNLNAVLDLAVGRAGLHLGVNRVFLPFCRPMLVPWSQIIVERRTTLGFRRARLFFGEEHIGRLEIAGHLADRMAVAAGGAWPEAGPFTRETAVRATSETLAEWVILAIVSATLFAALSHIYPALRAVPVRVGLVLPAIAISAYAFFRYVKRRGD